MLKLLLTEKLKFILVGALNTVVTYIVYLILLKLNLTYIFAFSISWIVAFVFALYFNIHYVFINSKKKNLKKILFKFFLLAVFQLVFSLYVLDILIQTFDFDVKIAPTIIILISFLPVWVG